MSSKWLAKCVFGFIALSAIASLAVMLLWNSTITAIFSLPAITYGQSLCLFVLCKILFKSGQSWMMNDSIKHYQWKKKLESMSPEERERFRSQWEKRCDKWGKGCKED